MNHELRTPLNAIIGFATMLRDSEDYELGADQRVTYAEYILQSADLLLGHINTLLDVAALDSGKVELNSDVIDFSTLLNDAINRVLVRAEAAGVAIERLEGDADVLGWGDADRIGQATDHLLHTAVKMSEEGGKVLVRVSQTDKGWAEIAIRDEGDGLSNEELYEALEVFNETLRGLDRSWMGPGVGYAIAKTFVEMQGGRFSIESRLDEGTLVQIALPPPNIDVKPIEDSEQDETEQTMPERKNDAA
ncbi:HAMP domain-containing sensor histidine kinase [Hyphococcus flavus]|uniref:histidine kinase n=1 Tax=Hyphococcus flavus TaxID=1866326 RepID=A0AAE9ZDS8_9PROT|nr:HAMP domain-containing sensor histidine kinase [Hyphococcus flavus]WDI30813.1 HAMP domain-containing sensor histidine kinase [Hyphococcus flavus]